MREHLSTTMYVDKASLKEEDKEIEEGLGYPRAYAKLCRDGSVGIYSHGPPFTFTPYVLQQHKILREEELDQMFPIVDPKAKPTVKPKIFVSLLWKQLNHLGNAGFDPAVIRIDQYGNVVYFHADKASPLAWDIDHWFPTSRAGLTVASNLRILQWQVCKRKQNKLEYLVPWWDLQLGISVNQFLSIFASSNSDFRHRAFSFLFSEGETEELNASQTVESLAFPRHFFESKDKFGLAPAAVVITREELQDSSSALRALDFNRQIGRPNSPVVGKVKAGALKENENTDFVTDPYQAIIMARESLRKREEGQKMQREIQKLGDEVDEMSRKNEKEKFAIQDLEMALIKRRRRLDKCRRLAEAQTSYRTMLEKMIHEAMHQSVLYKEQARLNQAATNALTARLEAQKAITDASERELQKKFKQRDELERLIRPGPEQARKRSRTDDSLLDDTANKTVLCLPGIRPETPRHKELREFLVEEQRASEAGLSTNEDTKLHEISRELVGPAKDIREYPDYYDKTIVSVGNEIPIEHKPQPMRIGERERTEIQFLAVREQEIEEDEESRQIRGKGNVERWLQMLLEDSQEDVEHQNFNGSDTSWTERKFPQEEAKSSEHPGDRQKVEENESCKSPVGKERTESVKKRGYARSESARILRHIPSSPSVILGGMRKGVECMRKKHMVISDDDCDEYHAPRNSFIKTVKKAVKI